MIEAGHANLVRQGLSLVDGFTALPAWLLGAELRSVTVNSAADLGAGLKLLAADSFEPDLLVLIGHSNRAVLAVDAIGPHLSWPTVAPELRRIAPRRILVLGCEAAHWLPCRAMFEGIRELREVYGSPVKLGAGLARLVPMAIPFLLSGRVDTDMVSVLSFGAMLRGEFLVRRTRGEFARTSDEEGEAIEQFESALGGLVRALRR